MSTSTSPKSTKSASEASDGDDKRDHAPTTSGTTDLHSHPGLKKVTAAQESSSYSTGANPSGRRTPGSGSIYLKLPLRGSQRSLKEPEPIITQQPLLSRIGQTVSLNRLFAQQPLGGNHPIPPFQSATMKSQATLQLKKKSSHMSQMHKNGYVEDEQPDPISFLSNTDHLFMRKCNRYPEGLESFQRFIIKREIVNSSGHCIYYSGQRINNWRWSCSHEFSYHVFDSLGRTVVLTQGTQRIFGITASATIHQADGSLMGSIRQDVCDSGYIILDGSNQIQFRVRGPCYAACTPCVFWCCDEHFEIDQDDGVTEVGLISTHWRKAHHDYDGKWGVHFPMTLENHKKALLLGAALLIHFQFYRRGGNGVCVCLLICLLLGAFLAFWFMTDGFGIVSMESHNSIDNEY